MIAPIHKQDRLRLLWSGVNGVGSERTSET
jgi:hypothetical protein